MLIRLLRWLLSFFYAPATDDPGLFQPAQRRLYRYFDGQGMVTADPMVLWKRVLDVGPELNRAWRLSNSPSKDARSGYEDLLKSVRSIFNIKPLEEGGLTEGESTALLNHFFTYCGEVKKNWNLSQTTPPSMDSTASFANPLPTTNTSDSGSTGSGSNTEPPTSSQPGPALP